MDPIILDKEKFNAVKELAAIHENIRVAKEALETVKKDTNNYFKVREEEVTARINKVLGESKEALEEITNNHNEVSQFRDDTMAYATELKNFATTLVILSENFMNEMMATDKKMDEHFEKVSAIHTQTKNISIAITEDRKMLERERGETNDRMRKVLDKEGEVNRKIERLKTNKI